MKEFDGTVKRCHAGAGPSWTTWIEPPLDNRWTDLTKLEWWAAVVSYDTGLPVKVRKARMRGVFGTKDYMVEIDTPDLASASVAMTGPFDHTWDHLAGVLRGAQAARAMETPTIRSLIDRWRDNATRHRAAAVSDEYNSWSLSARANRASADTYDLVARQAQAALSDMRLNGPDSGATQ